MTREDFEKRMAALEDKEIAVRQEMKKLQREYLANYPIHPDDKCVDRDGKVCWVDSLCFLTHSSTKINFRVNYAKQDGSRSKRWMYVYDVTKFK